MTRTASISKGDKHMSGILQEFLRWKASSQALFPPKRNRKWKILKNQAQTTSRNRRAEFSRRVELKIPKGIISGIFGRSQLLQQFGNSSKLDFANKRFNSYKSGSNVDIHWNSSLKTYLMTHQEEIAVTGQVPTPKCRISIVCQSRGWRDVKPAPSGMQINVPQWATPLLGTSYYSPRSQ